MVPGHDGELDEGRRLYNWVWYLNKTGAELQTLMTDKYGQKRQYTMPATFLSEESLTTLNHLADAQLPPILRNRIHQTKHPFVQVIFDLAAPKMHEGSVCILGDAACVVRPHTASGTAKAYRDAISLAGSLTGYKDIKTALQVWDDQQTSYAAALAAHGKQLAARSGLGFK